MKKVQRIVAQPAIYNFECFMQKERFAELGWPENINTWGWHSMTEVRDAVHTHWKFWDKQHPRYIAIADKFPLTFKPENYVELNRDKVSDGAVSFTWFIHYQDGMLFLNRPPQACPFNDPDLYVPTGWSKRVISAANQLFERVDMGKQGLIATLFDGSKERI